MQTFKSVSFIDSNSGKSKAVSVSFTGKEQSLFDFANKLSSAEIRRLINIESYEDLVNIATTERRSVSQYIKVALEKYVEQNPNIIAASDVTFKNSKDIPVQRWYPYIEGYSPDFVKALICQYINEPCLIYEPFAGTGTTLLAADALGFSTLYSEINPLLQLLIEVKLFVLSLSNEAKIALAESLRHHKQNLLKFSSKPSKDLLDNYIAVFKKSVYFPTPNLNRILSTRTYLDSVEDIGIKNILTVAVMACLIPSSFLKKQGDLRFKNEKEIAKGIPAFENLLSEKLDEISRDLFTISDTIQRSHQLLIDNAKELDSVVCEKIGAVISSPPYLNGTNYIRNTKLELWFLRQLKSEKDLRSFRDKILTSGINDVKVSNLLRDNLSDISETYKSTIESLSNSAYDMRIPLMAKGYFSEMYTIFEKLSAKLTNGAKILLDLGDSIFNSIHVKTDIILIEILASLGYQLKERKVLRERRSKNGQALSQVLIYLQYSQENV